MKKEHFEELLVSIQQAGAIKRGEQEPVRKFKVEQVDVKKIRENYNLSQSEFSKLLGISVRTLHNWEQGRRTPVGSARVLLHVAAKYPEELLNTVKEMDLV